MIKKLFSFILAVIAVFTCFSDVCASEPYGAGTGSNAYLVSRMPARLSDVWPVDSSGTVTNNADGHIMGHHMYIIRENNRLNPDFVDLRNTVSDITRGMNTDYLKMCAIVEWVNDNIEYVYFDIPGNTIDGVYHLFKNRHGNCMGLTLLTNFMLAVEGIPAASVIGEGHNWSLVLADGEWYMADSTNDYIGKDYNSFKNAENISFSVGDLSYILNSADGLMLSGIGEMPTDGENVTEITLPDYIDGIYETAFEFTPDDLIISGNRGAAAENYIRQNSYACVKYSGNTFSARRDHNLGYGGVCDLCGVSDGSSAYTEQTDARPDNPTPIPASVPSGNYDEVFYINCSPWAVPEIQAAFDNFLIDKTTIGDYQANITREEFCGLVVRMVERKRGYEIAAGQCYFNDTNDPAVIKAYTAGIVNGVSDTEFDPLSPITRQEICVMLVRAIKTIRPDIDTTAYTFHSFGDIGLIDAWAYQSVQYAYDNNIIQGFGNNMLMPLDYTTNEEAVILINRIYNNY